MSEAQGHWGCQPSLTQVRAIALPGKAQRLFGGSSHGLGWLPLCPQVPARLARAISDPRSSGSGVAESNQSPSTDMLGTNPGLSKGTSNEKGRALHWGRTTQSAARKAFLVMMQRAEVGVIRRKQQEWASEAPAAQQD